MGNWNVCPGTIDRDAGVVACSFVDLEWGPLVWVRHYRSDDCERDGPLGPGLRHDCDWELELEDGRTRLRTPQGRTIEFFSGLRLGVRATREWTLEREDRGQLIARGPGSLIAFERPAETEPSARCSRVRRIVQADVERRLDYDERGRLVRIEASQGPVREALELRWDDERIVRVEREGVCLLTYTYSDAGELSGVIDALELHQRHRWRKRRMVYHEDRRGHEWFWDYDRLGRCVTRRDAVDRWRLRLSYDEGSVHARDVDEGAPPRMALESTPGPARVEPAPGARFPREAFAGTLDVPASVRADLRGHFGAPTAQDAPTPAPERDAIGRVVARVSACGNVERLRLGPGGEVVERRDLDGQVWRYAYDSSGLLTEATDPEGHRTQWRHDQHGRVVGITDANADELSLRHDARARTGALIWLGRVLENYEYDEAGQLVARLDARGDLLVRHTYDARGRLASRELADGEIQRFEHDERGRLARATDSGGELRRDYDDEGRLLAESLDGLGVEYRYDDGDHSATSYFGRFSVQRRSLADGSVELHTPDGSVQRLRRTATGYALRELGNGSRELAHFDHRGRCSAKLGWRRGDADPRWSIRYERSPGGELRAILDSERGPTRYSYDRAHRLIEEQLGEGEGREYQWDPAGNLMRGPGMTLELGPGGRIEAINTNEVQHDHRGRISSLSSDKGLFELGYDALDRLSTVRIRRHGQQGHAWTAQRDALGRRVGARWQGRSRRWWWSRDRLMAEAWEGGPLRVYVYASASASVPIMFVDYPDMDAEPREGRASWVFTDDRGAPLRVEDVDGEVVWSARRVDPLGNVEVDVSELSLDLRPPRRLHSPVTGLQCEGRRSYASRLGRHVQGVLARLRW